MPADRDEVRFSENLEKILALQQAQGRTEIEIRPESKQVQQVGDTDRLVSQLWLTVRALRELQLADAWKLKLLCGCGAHQLVIQAEEIRSDLAQVGAIDCCKFHLQHHLAIIRRRRLNQIHHGLRMHRSDGGGLLCDLGVADDAGEKNRVLAARDVDLFGRKCRAQLFMNFGQIRLNRDQVRRNIVAMPDHDGRVARRFAVQYDVVGRNDDSIGNPRIGNRDA